MPVYTPEQHGNKTTNLDQLTGLFAHIPGVVIPEFVGLAHNEITSHLMRFGIDLAQRWQLICLEMGTPPTLNPNVKSALQQLANDIKACLKANPLTFTQLTPLLVGKRRNLIARSTSKEDTEALANAGGNESVANVKQSLEAISEAIGIVLASYLSEKSLMQRQLANDDITALPFIPVLLQEMITAQEVKSGVIYINNNGVFIQAAHGHGELVVNSKGPVDSYWYTPNHIMVATIVEKPIRIVPSIEQDNTLTIVNNSAQLANSPSLPPAIVERLAMCAKVIHDHYKKPMDIEYVYSPEDDTIYLVQARPVVNVQHSQTPSALHPELVDLAIKKKVWLTGQSVILPGNSLPLAHARKISQANEVLIIKKMNDEELKKAIELATTNQLKVVVVEHLLPATSHEAATLNGAGLPIIILEKTTELKQILAKATPEQPVYFDRQRSAFLATSSLTGITLSSEQWIQTGLFASSLSAGSTPLPTGFIATVAIERTKQPKQKPLATLIQQSRNPDPSIAEPALNELLNHLMAIMDSDQSKPLTTHNARVACHTTLTNLSASNDETAHQAIGQLLRYSLKLNKTLNTSQSNLIFQNIVLLAAEYIETREQTNTSVRHELLLDLAKKIEGLLFNEAKPNEFNYSMHSLLTEKRRFNFLFTQAKDHFGQRYQQLEATQKAVLVALLHFNAYLLTEQGKTEWDIFCFNLLSKQPHLATDFLNLLNTLNKEGLLETAIYLVIVPDFKNSQSDFPAIIEQLHAFITFKQTLFAQYNEPLSQWENSMPQWGDPDLSHEEFTRRCQQLKQDGISLLNQSNPTNNQYVISQLKLKFIDLVDNSIKALKANTQLPIAEKLTRFIDMIAVYKHFSDLLVALDIDDDKFRQFRRTYTVQTAGEPLTVNDMLAEIDKKFNALFNQKTGEEQLLSSGEFSVYAALINTPSSFSRSFILPKMHWENFYSFCHQQCLACIQSETSPKLLKKEYLPFNIQLIINSFANINYLNIDNVYSKPFLLKNDFKFPELSYRYNLPLRNHSATFEIKIDVVTKIVAIKLVMIGINIDERMTQIAGLIQLDCMASNTTLSELTVKKDSENTIVTAVISFSLDQLTEQLAKSPNYLTEYFVKYFDISFLGHIHTNTTYPSIMWTIANHREHLDQFVDSMLLSLENGEWDEKDAKSKLIKLQWRGPPAPKLTDFRFLTEFYTLLLIRVNQKISANPEKLEIFEPLFAVLNLNSGKEEMGSFLATGILKRFLPYLPKKLFEQLSQIAETNYKNNLEKATKFRGLAPLLAVIKQASGGKKGIYNEKTVVNTLNILKLNAPKIQQVLMSILNIHRHQLRKIFKNISKDLPVSDSDYSIKPEDIYRFKSLIVSINLSLEFKYYLRRFNEELDSLTTDNPLVSLTESETISIDKLSKLLSDYIQQASNSAQESFYGSFFTANQKCHKAIEDFHLALNDIPVDVFNNLSAPQNSSLVKLLQQFVKDGHASKLLNRNINTINELTDAIDFEARIKP